MQLVIGLPFVVLLLLLGSEATPTFDHIAEVLLNSLEDKPHYAHPVHSSHPLHYAQHGHHGYPQGPLIEEGYDHGYDYYYGGGGSHGYGNAAYQSPPPPPPPPQYYQRPNQGPVKGYYPNAPYPYNNYGPPSGPNYGPDYGQSYGRSPGRSHNSVGGYKDHGY